MDDYYNAVDPNTLEVLPENTRKIFTAIFIVLTIFSLMGNIAAIWSISRRKYMRFIQKVFIISLASSDILSTVIIALNNIDTFSRKFLTWTLGKFMCSFIPLCQMAGITASSLALFFIAMDRYRSVVNALNKKWNPTITITLIWTSLLWICSFGLSGPMYNFFQEEGIMMYFFNSSNIEEGYETERAKVCISFKKSEMRAYYISMMVLIFVPLLIVFVWFYYNIAALVWRHRKPVGVGIMKSTTDDKENSSSKTTGSTDCYSQKITVSSIQNLTASPISVNVARKDIRVERKIRTFKIIITLMVVFIGCRLPYHLMYCLKLSLGQSEYGQWTWNLNYALVALQIFNCILNPLLYTFLTPTIKVCIRFKKSVERFVSEICCFCFSSSEFENFEKDNPFLVASLECEKGKNSRVTFVGSKEVF